MYHVYQDVPYEAFVCVDDVEQLPAYTRWLAVKMTTSYSLLTTSKNSSKNGRMRTLTVCVVLLMVTGKLKSACPSVSRELCTSVSSRSRTSVFCFELRVCLVQWAAYV